MDLERERSRERAENSVVLPSTGYVIWYLGHVPFRIDRPTSSQPGGLHLVAPMCARFSVQDLGATIAKTSREAVHAG